MTRNDKPLRILICPNAFKLSLTSVEAAQAIAEGLLKSDRQPPMGSRSPLPFETDLMPLADGGDGTLETLVAATGGTIYRETVTGPLGDPVEAEWGRLGGNRTDMAIIEMARASGLALLKPTQYDPLHSTTSGTGELMLAAQSAGCTRLLIGIGGSATNDGGAGMATALGARLLDDNGDPIPPGGSGLQKLTRIDMSGWKLRSGISVSAACDVDNPLTGASGASATYGPQKGASTSEVRMLDRALSHYASLLESHFGVSVSQLPGAGAAGGLGAGLTSFCQAALIPGTEMVLDTVAFDRHLELCDVVITGEGKIDSQTARGKVIGVVAKRSAESGKPCIALVGGIESGSEELLRAAGLTAAFSIIDAPMSLELAMMNGKQLLSNAAERLAHVLRAVRDMDCVL